MSTLEIGYNELFSPKIIHNLSEKKNNQRPRFNTSSNGENFLLSFVDFIDGVSEESKIIQEISKERLQSTLNTETLISFKAEVEELSSILNEKNEVGWDGYDALPITINVVKNTLSFLTRIPMQFEKPDILPEPNGSIGLTWGNNKNSITVSISDKKDIIFAGLREDSSEMYGTMPFHESNYNKILNVVEAFLA